MRKLTREEIIKYVVEDVSMWFSTEEGNEVRTWDWEKVLNYFEENYYGDFELAEE